MYEYIATAKGTLTQPFRNVQPGDLVRSKTPLKGSWLVPKGQEVKLQKDLPLMTGMKPHARGRDALPPQNAQANSPDKNYNEAIAAVKKIEAIQDGVAAQATSPVASEPSVQGSGNQEVL